MKVICLECREDINHAFRHDDFDAWGDIGHHARCPYCYGDNIENMTDDEEFNFLYGSGNTNKNKIGEIMNTRINKNEAVNYFAEKIQKYYGTNPNWEEIIVSQNRVGGQDHDPKWECTMEYGGKSHTWSGYAKKKEVKKIVVAEWLELFEDEVFSALPETGKVLSNSQLNKRVPLNEKLNTLKDAKILSVYLDRSETHLVHAAYADYIRGDMSATEIKERYNI